MAVLTAALQDRRNVLGERNSLTRRGGRLLRLYRVRGNDATERHAEHRRGNGQAPLEIHRDLLECTIIGALAPLLPSQDRGPIALWNLANWNVCNDFQGFR